MIRDFCESDIPTVAALWASAFHKHANISLDDIGSYIHQIFSANPWRTEELPSLVHEDSARHVTGFLGVVPRQMLFRGEPIQVAVASQLMVDKNRRSAFAPMEM